MLNGARGFAFEQKYKDQEGVDLKLFWDIYDKLHSLDSRERDQAEKAAKDLPYQEDLEAFIAFKKDADATEGTAGYQFAQLRQLRQKDEELRKEIKTIQANQDAIVKGHAQRLAEHLANGNLGEGNVSTPPAETNNNQKHRTKRRGCTLV